MIIIVMAMMRAATATPPVIAAMLSAVLSAVLSVVVVVELVVPGGGDFWVGGREGESWEERKSRFNKSSLLHRIYSTHALLHYVVVVYPTDI